MKMLVLNQKGTVSTLMIQTQVNRKRIVLLLAVLSFAAHIPVTADTPGIPIDGPWLWMVVPTDVEEGIDISPETDSLDAASGGVVTEAHIAQNGVTEGATVGDLEWKSDTLTASHRACEEFSGFGFFGIQTKTECWHNNINDTVKPLGYGTEDDMVGHTAYALINLFSPRNAVGTMYMRSGDAVKVWLNGEIVYRQAATRLECRKVNIVDATDGQTCNPDPRTWEAEQRSFRVTLNAGDNLLMIKTQQDGEYWDMRVELEADFITSISTDNIPPLVILPSSGLTETTLDQSVVTLWLTGGRFESAVSQIRDGISVSGLPGVTINPDSVQRRNDKEVTVALAYNYISDIDTDVGLTFIIDPVAIAGYTGAEFSATMRVVGIEESVSARASSSLTETTLDGSVVTLTLTGRTYTQDVLKIREAVSVSGLPGVTIKADSVQRVSDTVITVELDFDGTDFHRSSWIILNVGEGAIANYRGDMLTDFVEYVDSVSESVSASTVSSLTETTLDGSVVTLTLTGRTYTQNVLKIREAVSVSGLPGVTIKADSVQRVSDTVIKVGLAADGTDFDINLPLIFNVGQDAVASYKGDAITTQIYIKESFSAAVASPLREATLDGSVVTLTLTGLVYEPDIAKIRGAVSVSGLPGLTIQVDSIQRISDIRITVELEFDGTSFSREPPLTFSVNARAIADYTGDILTNTSITVTPSREDRVTIYWVQNGYFNTGIRHMSLNDSNISGFSVEFLAGPRSIALDVAGGKVYWTESYAPNASIGRADFDGSNGVRFSLRFDEPYGIALDLAGGKMYWTTPDRETIQRANLDGSNVENLVTGLGEPHGIALDVAGGKMYWTDQGTDKIRRANLDGSNIEDLVTTGLDSPRGIALDVAGGKMYWTDGYAGKIQRANFDGSNVEDLLTGLGAPIGIALDVLGGKMYWTDNETEKIQRANLDGSNIEDLITGLEDLYDIAVAIAPASEFAAVKEDVNRDGVVDTQDLLHIVQRYGQTGQNWADVNTDGVVNIDDLIAVAAVIDNASAAPSARSQLPKRLTAATVNQWLTEAKLTGKRTSTYQRGIRFLEQLLSVLTPKQTALLPNYPNPFNPETWIPYHLASDADVLLSIYDINGMLVRALDLGYQQAGYYTDRSRAAYWDGRNGLGEGVASGVYFYQLSASSYSQTRKMLILK